jgi:GDPmannose 4,6-dehydratase
MARAEANPVTPAPMTATSISLKSCAFRGIGESSSWLRLDEFCRTTYSQRDMSKRAVITGITGQDGSYLAELLLEKGYEVVGSVRRASAPNYWRIQHLLDRLTIRPADLLDQLSIIRLVDEVRPHEFYNLAAMSFVPASWDQPMLTGEFNAQGVTRVLEAIRQVDPSIRIYQASSSEMFGKVREIPQTELTPFYPRSPYGVSKVFAHYITVNYRESYSLFAVSGMLFNHESPRRGLEFVTRKVTDGVARIKLGQADTLSLGNLDAHRDWGFAGDYVRAMWMMLQQDQADDYVIATGESHSVRDLVEVAFARVGLDWKKYVRTDPKMLRPAEVEHLIGNSTKARQQLGWQPTVDFTGLIQMMVDADLERLKSAPPPLAADRMSTL